MDVKKSLIKAIVKAIVKSVASAVGQRAVASAAVKKVVASAVPKSVASALMKYPVIGDTVNEGMTSAIVKSLTRVIVKYVNLAMVKKFVNGATVKMSVISATVKKSVTSAICGKAGKKSMERLLKFMRHNGVGNLKAKMRTVRGKVGDLVKEVVTCHANRAWAIGALFVKRRRLGEVAECQVFESRVAVFNEIMEALENKNVYTIGIYGKAGVGKTKMARKIAKQAKNKKLFDKTLLLTISQNPDIWKVQGELADFLGLTLDEESLPGRASLLCTRFKQKGEKILVIVDDVLGQINMDEVGIPLNGYSKGCKIVFTSRNQHVLIGEGVGVDEVFQIEVLSRHEAWLLFMKKLQNSIDSNTELRSVAEEICRKCGGLPLAIVTHAATLRGKEAAYWKWLLECSRTVLE